MQLSARFFHTITKGPGTYKGRPHGYRPPLVPRLHDGTGVSRNPSGQFVEVASNELMLWEVITQRIEELHETGRYILRYCQIWSEGQSRPQVPYEPAARQWMIERFRACCVSNSQETIGYQINIFRVELIEFALIVDENHALVWLLRERIVADSVVGEVVKDLQSNKIAWCTDIDVPVEYGLVDDFYMAGMASGSSRRFQLRGLQRSESR